MEARYFSVHVALTTIDAMRIHQISTTSKWNNKTSKAIMWSQSPNNFSNTPNDQQLRKQQQRTICQVPDVDEIASLRECWRNLTLLEDEINGEQSLMVGPFGHNELRSCDGSGRSLSMLENTMTRHILPLYSSTHTDSNHCAIQTNKFRESSRMVIAALMNLDDSQNVVLFVSGDFERACRKIAHSFKLRCIQATADNQTDKAPSTGVVLVSGCDTNRYHNSWRRCGLEVRPLPCNQRGQIELFQLIGILEKCRQEGMELVLLCLQAVSRTTGFHENVKLIYNAAHSHGAHVFWDYSGAMSYSQIPINEDLSYMDAVFINCWRLVGGVGSSNVLIMKRTLFMNEKPELPGGGTIRGVTRTTIQYDSKIELREEGGTPDILGSIRTGLAFNVERLFADGISNKNEYIVSKFTKRFKESNCLILLGGTDCDQRHPVFSFMVMHPQSGKIVHHKLIVALLNDIYGIQALAICGCHITHECGRSIVGDEGLIIEEPIPIIKRTKRFWNRGPKVLRDEVAPVKPPIPGYVQLSIPYHSTRNSIHTVISAVNFVVTEGWKYIFQYRYVTTMGIWLHKTHEIDDLSWSPGGGKMFQSLSRISFEQGKFELRPLHKENVRGMKSHDCLRKMRESNDIYFKSALDPATSDDSSSSMEPWYLTSVDATKYYAI